jgi:hypothetical protein
MFNHCATATGQNTVSLKYKTQNNPLKQDIFDSTLLIFEESKF